MPNLPQHSTASTSASEPSQASRPATPRSGPAADQWAHDNLSARQAQLVSGEWFEQTNPGQYPTMPVCRTWLVLGGRGAGKTRLGTEDAGTAHRRALDAGAELDGRPMRLCLTLGALAELESRFAARDLGELVERFSTGRLSAVDMGSIIGAGLRGAGHAVEDDEVLAMRCEGGVTGFAAIVSELLTATFGAEAPDTRP